VSLFPTIPLASFFGAFHIVHAERNAVAKANIELGNVAVQMFLAERTSE